MIKKTKRNLVCISAIIVLSAILFLFCMTIKNASGNNKQKTNIESYLNEHELPFQKVYIQNNTLYVEMLSEGSGRCTIDDIKGIQTIYEAVHGGTLSDNIENVYIQIYDTKNTLIYDNQVNGVSSVIKDIDKLVDQRQFGKEVSQDEIIDNVDRLLYDSGYHKRSIELEKAREIIGSRVVLSIYINGNEKDSVQKAIGFYEKLEEYSLLSGAIMQCDISFYNENDKCIMYMTGDFQYGDILTWISPELEKDFFANHGPK